MRDIDRTHHDGQICVVPTETGGSISCSGDSGGPLYQMSSGIAYLLGLVSWGSIDCTSTFNDDVIDVYTDVTSFYNWIGK